MGLHALFKLNSEKLATFVKNPFFLYLNLNEIFYSINLNSAIFILIISFDNLSF